MKFNGKDITKSSIDYAVVDRGEDKIVIKIKTILDYSDFDKLCPMPEAPTIKKPNKTTYKDVEDKTFKKEVEEYAFKKLCWSFMKSIEDSESLEFTNVDPSNSETWENVFTELALAFTQAEIDYILGKFNRVQGLSDARIKESTESFLAGLAKAQED